MQPVAMPRLGVLPCQGENVSLRRSGRGQGIAVCGHKNETLLQRLKFLAGLEAHCLARRDGDFSSSAGIPADSGLAWTNVEYPESAQLNPFTAAQRALHAFENCLDGHLRFRLGYARFVHHLIDDVEFDQSCLPVPFESFDPNPMVGLGLFDCQADIPDPGCLSMARFAVALRIATPIS